ncbi:MAG: DUF6364 family protein [Gemmatimonadaceae bacterium]
MKIASHRRRRLERDPEYALAMAAVNFEESLADLVVARRVAAGLSQAELARLARTTQATVSQIENGIANPRASTVEKLLSVLGLKGGETLLTLRLDAALIRRAKAYAKRTGTSVSAVVADYFTTLGAGEGQAPVLGPQERSLLGVLRERPVDETAYRRHLQKQHR